MNSIIKLLIFFFCINISHAQSITWGDKQKKRWHPIEYLGKDNDNYYFISYYAFSPNSSIREIPYHRLSLNMEISAISRKTLEKVGRMKIPNYFKDYKLLNAKIIEDSKLLMFYFLDGMLYKKVVKLGTWDEVEDYKKVFEFKDDRVDNSSRQNVVATYNFISENLNRLNIYFYEEAKSNHDKDDIAYNIQFLLNNNYEVIAKKEEIGNNEEFLYETPNTSVFDNVGNEFTLNFKSGRLYFVNYDLQRNNKMIKQEVDLSNFNLKPHTTIINRGGFIKNNNAYFFMSYLGNTNPKDWDRFKSVELQGTFCIKVDLTTKLISSVKLISFNKEQLESFFPEASHSIEFYKVPFIFDLGQDGFLEVTNRDKNDRLGNKRGVYLRKFDNELNLKWDKTVDNVAGPNEISFRRNKNHIIMLNQSRIFSENSEPFLFRIEVGNGEIEPINYEGDFVKFYISDYDLDESKTAYALYKSILNQKLFNSNILLGTNGTKIRIGKVKY